MEYACEHRLWILSQGCRALHIAREAGRSKRLQRIFGCCSRMMCWSCRTNRHKIPVRDNGISHRAGGKISRGGDGGWAVEGSSDGAKIGKEKG